MTSALVHFARLGRIGWIFVREGALNLVDASFLPPRLRVVVFILAAFRRRKASEADLSRAFMRMGPAYVKLGQFLATRPDVVGEAWARRLSTLQDRMPFFPQEEALEVIRNTLGAPEILFQKIDGPAAAASIAQVHRAIDAEGRDVAVKILRPGIRARFTRDMETIFFAAGLLERWIVETRRLRATAVVENFSRLAALETDLRLEAAALSELAENSQTHEKVRMPTVDWARTSADVLTTSWIEGISISEIETLRERGWECPELARRLMQSFLRHALEDGFFHADLHPGNVFVDSDGVLVFLDCGVMGRLGFEERDFLAEILYGFITKDYKRVAEAHLAAGYVPLRHTVASFAQAIRAIGEPIHDRAAKDVSMARLLTLLLEVTRLFDMQTRTELILLQKTMVVVEGVCRDLDPDFNMWKTAEPVIRAWMTRNLAVGEKARRFGKEALAFCRTLREAPAILEKIDRLVDFCDASLSLSARNAGSRARFKKRCALAALTAGLILLW